MPEFLLLLIEALAVFCVAGWMIVAVHDNWRHPDLNLEAIAMVMRFDLMARDYPEEYAHVAHRKIDDPKLHRRAFRAVVWAETVAALALGLAGLLLLLASLGLADPGLARSAAGLALVWFVAIWAAFIAGGNYFHYWYCHHSSQTTHYLLLLWGLLTLILIAVG